MVIWAGIVFCGVVQSQETPLEDTIYLFNTNSDAISLAFEDTLRISSLYDSADKEDWHYIYRWNTGERTDGIQVKFEGKRKVLYIAQRLSAIHWPEEYDTFPVTAPPYSRHIDPKEDTCIVCAPKMDADTIIYEWWHDLFFKEKYPDTEQCVKAYRGKGFEWDSMSSSCFFCQATCIEGKDTTTPYFGVNIIFPSGIGLGSISQTRQETRWHDYNVWSMQPETRIHARLRDTIHFKFQYPSELYPEQKGIEIIDSKGWIEPCPYPNWTSIDSIDVYFKDSLFRRYVYGWVLYRKYDFILDKYELKANDISHFIYFGIKPNAQIETDSVWVFFPQYPYSNLGERVDVCLPPDAPLPSAEDTVQVFNLGPWNRELEYVEYAWYDGTKDISGADSVVGWDSVFHYTFGKMDSVAPDLYSGTLVTRVASDSLWQDTCGCYVPCTDAACSGYDTVRIYLHLLPSLKENVFLPRDSVLCAHLDLELLLPDTAAGAYHFYWLDKDSIELPYGHDTTRFTVQGMRGLDGFGAGTDTREPRFFQLRLDHKLCNVSFFDTLLVYDQVKPYFELPFHDTLICRNEPVELDSLTPHVYRPFYTFEWNDGKKGSAYTFTDSGLYILRFFVNKDFNFCGYDTASDTINVIWVDPAMTDIYLPADTAFCKDLSVTLDVRVPYPSTLYSWQDGPMPAPEEEFEEDTIIFTPPDKTIREEGTYNVLLLDTMGCRNWQEINVTVDACTPALEIPNVFTPNGDGVNDVLKFKQLEKCTDVLIEIVDRWGQPVMKKKVASAEDFEWNGRVNNTGARLPDGPYFYMVTYKNLYGKRKVQSGSITILGTAE